MTIRPAVAGEVDDLAALWLEAALEGFAGIFPPSAPKPTVSDLKTWLLDALHDADAWCLVAALDHPAGMVVVRKNPAMPTGMQLARLYVHPRRWGLGIGSRLHDAAIETARRIGATGLNLWVLEGNRRARAMYERRGWRLVPGRKPVGASGGVFDVLYQRDFG